VTELHFLRHAHAGDPMAWDGPDEARPLSPKGERQADRLGLFLVGVRFTPDVFITSPKLRASRTADIVATHLGTRIEIDDRLAALFDVGMLEDILRDAGDPLRPVLVGHDPDFSTLVAELCGAPDIPMKKGALARIDIERPLRSGSGTLRWLVPPDLLTHGR
jgi:phosphohistidine phosphatase SixA